MIKKLLTLVLFTAVTILPVFVNAQCVPDPTITVPGIYPDSATGLPSGTVGIPYSEDIQARVLTDTTLGGLTVIITNVVLTSVSGLPPGLTYSCTPASCTFPGGSNGCIEISGIPTTAGVYPITVILTANGTILGSPVPPQTQTIDYYSITIDAPTGVADLSQVKFELLPNKPNPAVNYTDVTFSSPVAGDFMIKMFNMLGKEVVFQNVRGSAGMNTFRINTEALSSGVYMLSVENARNVLTRRVIVSGK